MRVVFVVVCFRSFARRTCAWLRTSPGTVGGRDGGSALHGGDEGRLKIKQVAVQIRHTGGWGGGQKTGMGGHQRGRGRKKQREEDQGRRDESSDGRREEEQEKRRETYGDKALIFKQSRINS